MNSRPGVTAPTSGFQIEGCLLQAGYLRKTGMQLLLAPPALFYSVLCNLKSTICNPQSAIVDPVACPSSSRSLRSAQSRRRVPSFVVSRQ